MNHGDSVTKEPDLSPRFFQREKFILDSAASREAVDKFDAYADLLVTWQKRMNLVAPSTLPDVWQRHFHDSAQLWPLIAAPTKKNPKSLVDIGSGAGFPGLVLAILAQAAKHELEIHLIESTQKKAQFLRHVADILSLPLTIHAKRTEDMAGLKADIVTARAVAVLPDLFCLAQPFLHSGTRLLFLKGARAEEELTAAAKTWHFTCHKTPSCIEGRGMILQIENLHYKTGLNKMAKGFRHKIIRKPAGENMS